MLDLAMVLALGWSLRSNAAAKCHVWWRRGWAIGGLLLATLGAAAVLGTTPRMAELPHQGIAPTGGEDSGTEIGALVASGHWKVFWYRQDCEHCRSILPAIVAESSVSPGVRWILVDATDPPVATALLDALGAPTSVMRIQQPDPWLPTPQFAEYRNGQRRELPIPESPLVIDQEHRP